MSEVSARATRFAAPVLAVFCLMLAPSGCDRGAEIPPEQVMADIQYLADDALEGRGLGTAGLDAAAEYIAARFSQVGLQPGGDEGYFQTFRIDS